MEMPLLKLSNPAVKKRDSEKAKIKQPQRLRKQVLAPGHGITHNERLWFMCHKDKKINMYLGCLETRFHHSVSLRL